MTSHAAVKRTGMGICCVAGAVKHTLMNIIKLWKLTVKLQTEIDSLDFLPVKFM